jgi:hypothetical protein
MADDPGARLAAASGTRGSYEPGDFSTYGGYNSFDTGYAPYRDFSYTPENLSDMFIEAYSMGPGLGQMAGLGQVENKFSGFKQRGGEAGQSLYDQIFGFDWGADPASQRDAAIQYYTDLFGDAGISNKIGMDINDPEYRESVWSTGTGGELGRYKFKDNESTLGKIMGVVVPAIIGGGVGSAAGAAMGSAVGGGAVGGFTSSAMTGGDPFTGILTGAIGSGLNTGLESQLGEWFPKLKPGQLKGLSKLGTSAALNLAQGKGLDSMFLASQLPNVGLASGYVGGGDTVDPFEFSYNEGGIPPEGPSIGGGLGDVNTPLPGDFFDINASSPYDFGFSLGNSPESSGNGQQPFSIGSFGFDPSGVPPGLSGAPTAPPASGGYMDEMSKFFGTPQGKMIGRLLGMANPALGGIAGIMGQSGSGQRMDPMLAGLGALGTLYGYNRANSNLKQQQKSLGSLFSPNSPYAQQLRQGLERKDAAAGRRSQYGPREVQLQAELARLNAGNAPALAQLGGARDTNRQQMMMGLLGLLSQSGGLKSLEDMFSNIQTPFGPGVIG